MTTATTVVRADVVGSLLRPDYLREAREAARAGTLDADELRAVEDRAVLEAIALQESAGIEAITDGEYRRHGWIALIPIIDDPLFRAPVSGFEFLDAESGWRDLWKTGEGEPADTSALPPEEPFVTRRLEVDRDIVTDEFAFLEGERARAREVHDPGAQLAPHLLASGLLDRRVSDVGRLHRATSPASCASTSSTGSSSSAATTSRSTRRTTRSGTSIRRTVPRSRQHGHDMAHELVADAEFDSMVFDGLTGVTRAMHMCRGNAPGGMWAATGGYEAISKEVFPRLKNIDRLLLEYDSDRAGTFEPLADVLPQSRGRARARHDEGRGARGSRRARGAGRGGDAVRAARTAGDQPPVRLRVGRDRAR